jgi:hypothetical protein
MRNRIGIGGIGRDCEKHCYDRWIEQAGGEYLGLKRKTLFKLHQVPMADL